jgi:hypothetical protein
MSQDVVLIEKYHSIGHVLIKRIPRAINEINNSNCLLLRSVLFNLRKVFGGEHGNSPMGAIKYFLTCSWASPDTDRRCECNE